MIISPNIQIQSEKEMLAFGTDLADAMMKNGAVIFLYGPLGAGKTTLVRGFLRHLGYRDKVKSPTYTLIETYEIGARNIYHFDFYRLTNSNELRHIGIQEYFSTHSVCLIEWPEKGFPLLPEPDIACYISFIKPGREIRLEARTTCGEEILKRLQC